MPRLMSMLILILAALTSAVRPTGLEICVESDGVLRIEASGEACAAAQTCSGASGHAASLHVAHSCDDYDVLDGGHARPDELSPLALPSAMDRVVIARPSAPPVRLLDMPESLGAPTQPRAPRGAILLI